MRVVENHHCFPLIMNQPLQHVTEHPKLGVVIDYKISFSVQIDHVTFKAMNFIECKCDKEVKFMAYLCLVEPLLEYAAFIWTLWASL